MRKTTISFVMSIRPSVRTEQLVSHWTDFRWNWYLRIFLKTVEKIRVSLKSDKNKRYFIVIQHAVRMHHIVISSLPALQYFSTLSHKRYDFRRKKNTRYKMCVLIFSTSFVWNISSSRKKWARYDQGYKYTHSSILIAFPLQLWLTDTALLLNRYCSTAQEILLSAWGKQTAVSVWQLPVAVCTVSNSWRWTERPPETCTVSF